MRQLGITAYAALSVNIHMLAYEQAPRQPYACFLSQPRLCPFQAITQSRHKPKRVYLNQANAHELKFVGDPEKKRRRLR